MAAATVLGLSDEQAVHAFGNAGTQSAGLWQFLETGAMSKHLHAGRAAEAGLVAADLAALDFTGPPGILEGDKGFFAGACPDARPDAVLADPEAPWQLTLTSIKPWPSCRHTHPGIDAALEIHDRLAGREIESVQVEVYQAAMDVCDRPLPNSEYEAKFSIFHCIAAALADGEVNFESFSEASRQRLAGLRERIHARAVEPWVSAYPESWGSRVTVRSVDGENISADRNAARGDPELALSDADMVAKARMLLSHGGLDEARAETIVDGVLGLAEAGPAPAVVGQVCSLLRG